MGHAFSLFFYPSASQPPNAMHGSLAQAERRVSYRLLSSDSSSVCLCNGSRETKKDGQ